MGGSNYYAHVTVDEHPNAVITFEGEKQGSGTANFSAPRRNADSFSITVREPGCREQVFDFTERSFRGWSLAGSLAGGTLLISSIPLPLGLITDGQTGSLWKPDITEAGVSKIDDKNYHYNVNYTGCKDKPLTTTKNSKAVRITKLKKLLDEGILTKKEFKTKKKKILTE